MATPIHPSTHSLHSTPLKRREALTMPPFPPSAWKRRGRLTMTTLLHFSGGQGPSYVHNEYRGVATLTSTPLLEGRWEGDHGHTHPPIHALTPLHPTEEERSQDHGLLPCFLLEEDGEGDHDHTHPFPRKRRAEVITSFTPFFWKRDGGDHDHSHLHSFSRRKVGR